MLTSDTETIIAWKFKEFLDESISTAPGNSLAPKLKSIHSSKIAVEFKWSCLKQNKTTFTHINVVNLLVIYELSTWSRDLIANFTLGDCLVGAKKLNIVVMVLDLKYKHKF